MNGNEWTKQFSKKHQCDYWFNSLTNESTWTDPTQTIADINKTYDSQPQKKRKVEQNVEIAIIVPFKDPGGENGKKRQEQLKQFIPKMTSFLSQSNTTFRIYIIEQLSTDQRKFNRGKLLNIGFDIARNEECSIFIFHDVDLIPSIELLPSYTTVPHEQPVHIARIWGRYNQNNKYFGGVVAFSKDMFEQINGFPNNFWGWGGEDDELYKRVKECGYSPVWPTTGTLTDLEEMSLDDKLKFLKKNQLKCMNKNELLDTHSDTWRENGLLVKNNQRLNYDVLERQDIATTYAHIIVDIQLNNDWADSTCGLGVDQIPTTSGSSHHNTATIGRK